MRIYRQHACALGEEVTHLNVIPLFITKEGEEWGLKKSETKVCQLEKSVHHL